MRPAMQPVMRPTYLLLPSDGVLLGLYMHRLVGTAQSLPPGGWMIRDSAAFQRLVPGSSLRADRSGGGAQVHVPLDVAEHRATKNWR